MQSSTQSGTTPSRQVSAVGGSSFHHAKPGVAEAGLHSHAGGGSGTASSGKGKKRERVDADSEPSKRERPAARSVDIGDSGGGGSGVGVGGATVAKRDRSSHSKSDNVSMLVDKDGGLSGIPAVDQLLSSMQATDVNKSGVSGMSRRERLVGIIINTIRDDCLSRFVQIGGVKVIHEWLQDAQKGSGIPKGGGVVVCEVALNGSTKEDAGENAEALLFALLRALDRLPVDAETLRNTLVNRSVKSLKNHKSGEIQQRAKKLIDAWRKVVRQEAAEKQESGEVEEGEFDTEGSRGGAGGSCGKRGGGNGEAEGVGMTSVSLSSAKMGGGGGSNGEGHVGSGSKATVAGGLSRTGSARGFGGSRAGVSNAGSNVVQKEGHAASLGKGGGAGATTVVSTDAAGGGMERMVRGSGSNGGSSGVVRESPILKESGMGKAVPICSPLTGKMDRSVGGQGGAREIHREDSSGGGVAGVSGGGGRHSPYSHRETTRNGSVGGGNKEGGGSRLVQVASGRKDSPARSPTCHRDGFGNDMKSTSGGNGQGKGGGGSAVAGWLKADSGFEKGVGGGGGSVVAMGSSKSSGCNGNMKEEEKLKANAVLGVSVGGSGRGACGAGLSSRVSGWSTDCEGGGSMGKSPRVMGTDGRQQSVGGTGVTNLVKGSAGSNGSSIVMTVVKDEKGPKASTAANAKSSAFIGKVGGCGSSVIATGKGVVPSGAGYGGANPWGGADEGGAVDGGKIVKAWGEGKPLGVNGGAGSGVAVDSPRGKVSASGNVLSSPFNKNGGAPKGGGDGGNEFKGKLMGVQNSCSGVGFRPWSSTTGCVASNSTAIERGRIRNLNAMSSSPAGSRTAGCGLGWTAGVGVGVVGAAGSSRGVPVRAESTERGSGSVLDAGCIVKSARLVGTGAVGMMSIAAGDSVADEAYAFANSPQISSCFPLGVMPVSAGESGESGRCVSQQQGSRLHNLESETSAVAVAKSGAGGGGSIRHAVTGMGGMRESERGANQAVDMAALGCGVGGVSNKMVISARGMGPPSLVGVVGTKIGSVTVVSGGGSGGGESTSGGACESFPGVICGMENGGGIADGLARLTVELGRSPAPSAGAAVISSVAASVPGAFGGNVAEAAVTVPQQHHATCKSERIGGEEASLQANVPGDSRMEESVLMTMPGTQPNEDVDASSCAVEVERMAAEDVQGSRGGEEERARKEKRPSPVGVGSPTGGVGTLVGNRSHSPHSQDGREDVEKGRAAGTVSSSGSSPGLRPGVQTESSLEQQPEGRQHGSISSSSSPVCSKVTCAVEEVGFGGVGLPHTSRHGSLSKGEVAMHVIWKREANDPATESSDKARVEVEPDAEPDVHYGSGSELEPGELREDDQHRMQTMPQALPNGTEVTPSASPGKCEENKERGEVRGSGECCTPRETQGGADNQQSAAIESRECELEAAAREGDGENARVPGDRKWLGENSSKRTMQIESGKLSSPPPTGLKAYAAGGEDDGVQVVDSVGSARGSTSSPVGRLVAGGNGTREDNASPPREWAVQGGNCKIDVGRQGEGSHTVPSSPQASNGRGRENEQRGWNGADGHYETPAVGWCNPGDALGSGIVVGGRAAVPAAEVADLLDQEMEEGEVGGPCDDGATGRGDRELSGRAECPEDREESSPSGRKEGTSPPHWERSSPQQHSHSQHQPRGVSERRSSSVDKPREDENARKACNPCLGGGGNTCADEERSGAVRNTAERVREVEDLVCNVALATGAPQLEDGGSGEGTTEGGRTGYGGNNEEEKRATMGASSGKSGGATVVVRGERTSLHVGESGEEEQAERTQSEPEVHGERQTCITGARSGDCDSSQELSRSPKGEGVVVVDQTDGRSGLGKRRRRVVGVDDGGIGGGSSSIPGGFDMNIGPGVEEGEEVVDARGEEVSEGKWMHGCDTARMARLTRKTPGGRMEENAKWKGEMAVKMHFASAKETTVVDGRGMPMTDELVGDTKTPEHRSEPPMIGEVGPSSSSGGPSSERPDFDLNESAVQDQAGAYLGRVGVRVPLSKTHSSGCTEDQGPQASCGEETELTRKVEHTARGVRGGAVLGCQYGAEVVARGECDVVNGGGSTGGTQSENRSDGRIELNRRPVVEFDLNVAEPSMIESVEEEVVRPGQMMLSSHGAIAAAAPAVLPLMLPSFPFPIPIPIPGLGSLASEAAPSFTHLSPTSAVGASVPRLRRRQSIAGSSNGAFGCFVGSGPNLAPIIAPNGISVGCHVPALVSPTTLASVQGIIPSRLLPTASPTPTSLILPGSGVVGGSASSIAASVLATVLGHNNQRSDGGGAVQAACGGHGFFSPGPLSSSSSPSAALIRPSYSHSSTLSQLMNGVPNGRHAEMNVSLPRGSMGGGGLGLLGAGGGGAGGLNGSNGGGSSTSSGGGGSGGTARRNFDLNLVDGPDECGDAPPSQAMVANTNAAVDMGRFMRSGVGGGGGVGASVINRGGMNGSGSYGGHALPTPLVAYGGGDTSFVSGSCERSAGVSSREPSLSIGGGKVKLDINLNDGPLSMDDMHADSASSRILSERDLAMHQHKRSLPVSMPASASIAAMAPAVVLVPSSNATAIAAAAATASMAGNIHGAVLATSSSGGVTMHYHHPPAPSHPSLLSPSSSSLHPSEGGSCSSHWYQGAGPAIALPPGPCLPSSYGNASTLSFPGGLSASAALAGGSHSSHHQNQHQAYAHPDAFRTGGPSAGSFPSPSPSSYSGGFTIPSSSATQGFAPPSAFPTYSHHAQASAYATTPPPFLPSSYPCYPGGGYALMFSAGGAGGGGGAKGGAVTMGSRPTLDLNSTMEGIVDGDGQAEDRVAELDVLRHRGGGVGGGRAASVGLLAEQMRAAAAAAGARFEGGGGGGGGLTTSSGGAFMKGVENPWSTTAKRKEPESGHDVYSAFKQSMRW